jgi:cytochrome c oxidase subunit 3
MLKGVEYRMEYEEQLVPGMNFRFYFVATGLHAVHIAVGIVLLCAIGLQSHRGAYSSLYHTPITVVGLYWHFVDVVWIFLFALIYLPDRAS